MMKNIFESLLTTFEASSIYEQLGAAGGAVITSPIYDVNLYARKTVYTIAVLKIVSILKPNHNNQVKL